MTEAEALKRFIPILGRISTPGERATITRNVLERIAGQQTSAMGVSHKHAGALAWPNDHAKALEFERALDTAVDAGEFVSFIHRADRRHFQIEELSAWPNCPKVDTESPLTFWLGDVLTADNKPQAAPALPADTKPAPAAAGAGAGAATVWTPERKAQARAMLNKLRSEGVRAFARRTADAFNVSPTRLNMVLGEKIPKEKPKKKASFWPT
jgi:hypothetical protein